MLHVHRSNRTERLADALAEVVALPLASPADPEWIVVSGRGMERWLSMELSRRLGIWANARFPFPRHLIEFLLRDNAVAASRSPFAPEVLLWSVAALLAHYGGHREFADVHRYLTDDEHGVRRIQLAERLAQAFDQYVVYRPDLLRDWERGADAQWQAVLWRALVQRADEPHLAARADQLIGSTSHTQRWPARISIFGVSALPPLYVDILAAVGRRVDVHLFLLSPSREYWADIRSRREVLREWMRRDAGGAATPLPDDGGAPPLLASLGRLGRDFQALLETRTEYHETERDLYEDPGTQSMLACVQSDLLALRRRGGTDAPPLPFSAGDESIRIHACHGPMREVEVLHDQLLALFDADPTLQPHQIIVMSPSIDAYAPFIEAVFGGTTGPQPRIPYRIADRTPRASDDVAAAFFAILRALRGRFAATEILDVLMLAPVRERFAIGAEDIEMLRSWIKASGIRWGVDAAHRRAEGQPASDEHTWRFGLDRLLLGYAAPGQAREMFAGVLPYDDVEGTGTALLGRFVELCETLFTLRDSLQGTRPLAAWRDELSRLLERTMAHTAATAHEHQEIRGVLADLADAGAYAGFDEPVSLDVIELQVAAALDRRAPGRGFLGGGVTFCALVPMRSIPFRIVCLLGMNDADFPRVRRPPSFDLMARRPRAGDRSAREDDRYLFLEALLSARERLLITYVGRSIRDNSDMPPSVVVSELLDTLAQTFGPPLATDANNRAKPIRSPVVVRHHLQPFHPAYFDAAAESPLFSYSATWCDGARALSGRRGERTPFVPGPLPARAVPALALDDLVRFFEKPVRAFLQTRLGLYLGGDLDGIDDRQPLTLTGLEQWHIGSGLIERTVRDGDDAHSALAAVRASGALPPGALAAPCFAEVAQTASTIAEAVRERTRGTPLAPLVVDHDIAGVRLAGVVRNLWAAGLVQWQYARVGGRHELGVWIRHLVLNWVRPNGYPLHSRLIGRARDGGVAVVTFAPVADPAAVLAGLLDIFRAGCCLPLPLFEHASRTYAEQVFGGARRDAALAAAQRDYVATERDPKDEGDDYVRHVFDGSDPLDPAFRFTAQPDDWLSFAQLAERVYLPLLAHREQ